MYLYFGIVSCARYVCEKGESDIDFSADFDIVFICSSKILIRPIIIGKFIKI